MTVITEIGDGASTIFWKHKLLLEQNIEDLAPHLFELVPKRANKRMVLETLTNHQCIHDLQGALTEGAPLLISTDKLISRYSLSGQYTAKSAYDALFQGAVFLAIGSGYGSLGHLLNAGSSSGLWLATTVGQQMDWHRKVLTIQRFALSMMKNTRLFGMS
jgi:hypothetical protein